MIVMKTLQDKIFDIMVVGELNADLILDQLHKPPGFGKEQTAGLMTLTLGSSTAIYAANSASLGSKVAFCGKIGADRFGSLVMDSLEQKSVNTEYIITDPNLATGATVIIRYANDRMMVTHPGAMEHMSVSEVSEELFIKSRHLHTSSVFFQPGIKKNLTELFQKAKSFGLTTSMDAQWDPSEKWDLNLADLMPFLDFFLPNEQELLHLTGSTTLDEALKALSGYDTCIVVKCGNKGATMQYRGEKESVKAYPIPGFVDAVGAGDSFNAGFIHEFLKGRHLSDCLAIGNLTAAVSTTSAGGTNGIKSYHHVIKTGKSMSAQE